MNRERAVQQVDACLRQQCAELSSPLQEVCLAAVEGGRRIRAGLLLCAAQRDDAMAVSAACALEMLHAATLLQDDIFDGGTHRRGRLASHLRFGKAHTILASDWLLIRSLELAADVHPQYFKHLARTASSMAHAVAQELKAPGADGLSSLQSVAADIVHGKTAALFASALYAASLLYPLHGAAYPEWEELGRRIGHIYQLLDDCMDLYAEPERMGKPAGKDVDSGRLTQPLLFACAWFRDRAPAGHSGQGPCDLSSPAGRRQLAQALLSSEMREALETHLRQQLIDLEQAAALASLPLEAIRAFTEEAAYRMSLCFARDCRCLQTNESDREALGSPR